MRSQPCWYQGQRWLGTTTDFTPPSFPPSALPHLSRPCPLPFLTPHHPLCLALCPFPSHASVLRSGFGPYTNSYTDAPTQEGRGPGIQIHGHTPSSSYCLFSHMQRAISHPPASSHRALSSHSQRLAPPLTRTSILSLALLCSPLRPSTALLCSPSVPPSASLCSCATSHATPGAPWPNTR